MPDHKYWIPYNVTDNDFNFAIYTYNLDVGDLAVIESGINESGSIHTNAFEKSLNPITLPAMVEIVEIIRL